MKNWKDNEPNPRTIDAIDGTHCIVLILLNFLNIYFSFQFICILVVLTIEKKNQNHKHHNGFSFLYTTQTI